MRPGAREESASPTLLAAPAMNARHTPKGKYGGLTLDMDRRYIGSVTATTHQEQKAQRATYRAPEYNAQPFLRNRPGKPSCFSNCMERQINRNSNI